jgi:hypothetical protein
LPGGNVVDAMDETRTLRTNPIWSKGHVENTLLAENSEICVKEKNSAICEALRSAAESRFSERGRNQRLNIFAPFRG